MSLDWYRKHLGPAQSPVREPMPAYTQPTRFVVVEGKAYPVAEDGQPVVYPTEQPTQPWRQQTLDPPLGQMHALDAAQAWRGTREAQQVSSERCPHCGSRDYMPRLPNGRQGHCFACGARPDTGDDRGGPTLQPRNAGAVRGADGQQIPIEAARMTDTRKFGGWVSGRLSEADIVAKV